MHAMPTDDMFLTPTDFSGWVKSATPKHWAVAVHGEVFVVFEKHRSGVEGVASVHASLEGAKSSQQASGAVWRDIPGEGNGWFAQILEGHVTLFITKQELKP